VVIAKLLIGRLFNVDSYIVQIKYVLFYICIFFFFFSLCPPEVLFPTTVRRGTGRTRISGLPVLMMDAAQSVSYSDVAQDG
jgi:hypothetical protein